MESVVDSNTFPGNITFSIGEVTLNSSLGNSDNGTFRVQSIRIIQSLIASVGIIANLTVIVVFLNHKKLRRKIPNIFIINQVSRNYIILNVSVAHKGFHYWFTGGFGFKRF